MDPLENCVGFDWDEANLIKIWDLHQVTSDEVESVFFRFPFVVRSDVRHSRREKRYYALGQTDRGRRLFVVFTVRRKLIRPISARDMNRRSMKSVKKKTLPEFAGEADEQKFWAKADSTEYLDWSAAKKVSLTRLKPSLRTISLRLPVAMLDELRLIANRRDVPYQSLLKVFLAERLAQERQGRH